MQWLLMLLAVEIQVQWNIKALTLPQEPLLLSSDHARNQQYRRVLGHRSCVGSHRKKTKNRAKLSIPIANNAILWVKKMQCKTKLERNEKTAPLFDIIARAESWLRAHPQHAEVRKWETAQWGEVPADFGRKK